jgi:hypothetical protein
MGYDSLIIKGAGLAVLALGESVSGMESASVNTILQA